MNLPPPPPMHGLLETSLYVSDLGRSKIFYERLFGTKAVSCDERFCAIAVARRQMLLLFRHGAAVAPIAAHDGRGIIPDHGAQGRMHVAFAINATDAPAWEARLRTLDVHLESTVIGDQPEHVFISLYFRDPDGHLIELASHDLWDVYQR